MGAITYRSNIDALRLQRQTDRTGAALSKTFEKLSSGLRINRSSDDPAAQAMAAALSADQKIAGVARLNVEQGVSALSIAEGIFSEAQTILSRMSEIANQGANGVLSSSQRTALQREMSALSSEITRLRESGRFGGLELTAGGVTGRAPTTIASAPNEAAVSVDGRWVTWIDGSGNLQQRDTVNGTTQTLAAGVSTFTTTPFADQIAYVTASSFLNRFDRLQGTTSTIDYGGEIGQIRFSDDGTKIGALSYAWWDASGSAQGEYFNYALSVYDVATGTIRGDPGNYMFSSVGLTDGYRITFSSDNSKVIASGRADWSGGVDYVAFEVSNMTMLHRSAGANSILNVRILNDGTAFVLSNDDLDSVSRGGVGNIFKTSDGGAFEAVTNLTSTTALSGVQSFQLVDGGTSISFIADSNVLGTNVGNRRQVFRISTQGSGLEQITGFNTDYSEVAGNYTGDGYSFIASSGGNLQIIDARPELTLGISTGTGRTGAIATGILALDGAVRGLEYLSISSQSSSRVAVDALNTARQNLSLATSSIGAGLSRLDAARSVLAVREGEVTQALSRVRDVDTASEIASMTRLQIIQDSQVALQAQANRIVPEIALQLLKAA